MADACKKLTVYRKSKATFGLKLKTDGDGEDLSTNDNIIVCFTGDNGTPVSVSKADSEVSILNATKGRISVTIPAAKTELMSVGEDQTIEIQVIVNNGDDPKTWQITECLDVIDSIC